MECDTGHDMGRSKWGWGDAPVKHQAGPARLIRPVLDSCASCQHMFNLTALPLNGCFPKPLALARELQQFSTSKRL